MQINGYNSFQRAREKNVIRYLRQNTQNNYKNFFNLPL